MYIKESVYFFSNTLEEVKDYQEKVKIWKEKAEIIKEKVAELFGIKTIENNINISTAGKVLVRDKIMKELKLLNKVFIFGSQNMSINDEEGNYLGQWCELKKIFKEYNVLKKLSNELNFGYAPYIGRIIGKDRFSSVKCKYINLQDGVFFILNNNDVEKDLELKKAIAKAQKIKLSDFYYILEQMDEEMEENEK